MEARGLAFNSLIWRNLLDRRRKGNAFVSEMSVSWVAEAENIDLRWNRAFCLYDTCGNECVFAYACVAKIVKAAGSAKEKLAFLSIVQILQVLETNAVTLKIKPFLIRIFSPEKLFNYTLIYLMFWVGVCCACIVCGSNPTFVTGCLVLKWLTCFCVGICSLRLSSYFHGNNFYFQQDIFPFLLDIFPFPIRKSLLQSL